MPRDLGDVLHYFLPPPAPERATGLVRPLRPRAPDGGPTRAERPAALPIVALPIGERDVLRAAFAWNLTVELARLGASAALIAPAENGPSPLWPEPGRGPLGAELVTAQATGLGDLGRAALDVAVARAAEACDGGLVLVRVPPEWLLQEAAARPLLRWVLLFASTEPRDLLETYGLAKHLTRRHPDARLGVTIHGARRRDDAEQAFAHLAGVAARRLGRDLVSYGLLVDDLHVYRAIASRRPIGLEHPQSRAARALRDVARLLLDDSAEWPLA